MNLKQCCKDSRIKPIILNWFSLKILFSALSKAAQQYIYIYIYIYIKTDLLAPGRPFGVLASGRYHAEGANKRIARRAHEGAH
jgi:hypothetical protein